MAIWKVSAERAEIFPHPNSDRMDLWLSDRGYDCLRTFAGGVAA